MPNHVSDRIAAVDEITKSFQSEAEALRQIVRDQEAIISALKCHCVSLSDNVVHILESIIEKFPGTDVAVHATNMVKQIRSVDVVGLGSIKKGSANGSR